MHARGKKEKGEIVNNIWNLLHPLDKNDCHTEENQVTHLEDEHDEIGKEQEMEAVIVSAGLWLFCNFVPAMIKYCITVCSLSWPDFLRF